MPNRQQKSAYRREGSRVLVDIKLKTLAQLYNSFDPSPFHERDLDDAAAEYIEDAVTEIHATEPEIKLVVHVQEPVEADAVSKANEAIHNYFSYRAHVTRLRLRRLMRSGRISLLVGLLFMAFCFELSRLTATGTGAMPSILQEGFLIIGWVAMWKPLDIFLYSWWPIVGKIRLYEKIAAMPVEFNQNGK
jgi:hypothetical protein